MIKYFTILIMLLSNSAFAEAPIKLVLENHNNDYLSLYLVNVSESSILVNKRFALGSSIDPSEVELTIINKEGKEYGFQARISVTLPTEEDVFLLEPGKRVGEAFRFEELIQAYVLTPGEYRVQAKYKHLSKYSDKSLTDKNVFSGPLTSNWVTMEIK